MRYDIFFGFSQVEVDGRIPSEHTMFSNLFDQVQLADELGFHTAWVGGAHLSLAEHQQGPSPVLPHFRGEVCLNTDILQLAHVLFARTERIHVGSAIHNILCNGGPVAQAEALRTFLSLHRYRDAGDRRLYFGVGGGRFGHVNAVYGVKPRSELERVAWGPLRGLILSEALEIFLRLLRGDSLASTEVTPKVLQRRHFRSEEDWEAARAASGTPSAEALVVPPYWTFDRLRLIPREVSLEPVRIVLGSHDPEVQERANQLFPCQVFNLSVTPPELIEATHARMEAAYHPDGGAWQRAFMPRTVMVFVDGDGGGAAAQQERAERRARQAVESYWRAMAGTIDQAKVDAGVSNAVCGGPGEVARQLRARFHSDDALMLWFDFADHDNARVLKTMRTFWEQVVPLLEEPHVRP